MGAIAGIFSPEKTGPVQEAALKAARRMDPGVKRDEVLTAKDGTTGLWQAGPEQPARKGPLTLILDGEIYNQPELIAAYDFASNLSNTELALALYEARGTAGLSDINGDLALAVYDESKKELLLFRDRFGIRPLYYVRIGDDLLFASKPDAFFSHPDFKAEPNEAMLFDFLATHYRYIHRDPGRTYLAGVRQVKPSHYLTVGPETTREDRYWRLSLDPQVAALKTNEAECVLKFLITDCVIRRLDVQRPMGFSVSSGMDSSSVASLAAGLMDAPPDLYSVGYGSGEYDEAGGIAPLAEFLEAKWRNIILEDPPLLNTVDQLVRVHDGPLCTVTWLSHYYLSKAAAEDGKKLIFSGLGGDECLAGEYEHFLFFFADLKTMSGNGRLDAEIDGWITLHDHPVFKKSRRVVDDAFKRLVDLSQPGVNRLDENRYRAYLPFFEPDYVRTHDRPPEMPSPFKSYLANRCYQDLFYETTPPSLRGDEKNVRHFGLSSRFLFSTTASWNSVFPCRLLSNTTME